MPCTETARSVSNFRAGASWQGISCVSGLPVTNTDSTNRAARPIRSDAETPTPEVEPGPTTKRASYRSGFLFGTLSFLGVAGVGFISTIVTSRLYGVRIIGQFALVSAPVIALWLLSTVKEQQALIKEITHLPPRHPRVTQLFAVVFTFSSILTAVVAILDAVVCWFVFRGPLHASYLIAPVLVSLAGYTIVTNTGWNIDSVLSAFIAGRQIFWVRLHEVVSFLTISIVLGLAWRSVWGLVIATIGGSATALIHRIIVVRPFARARLTWAEYRIGLRVLPELLRFGLKATPGQIAQGVSQQAGIWALGIVAPVAVVGAYSRAQTIPQRLQQANTRVTEVLYPTLVGRHARGHGHGFDRALIDSIRYQMIGLLLIAAVIGGAAHSTLRIFGPGFGLATSALALVMLYPALASMTSTQTQALWATSRPGITSVIALVRLTITMVLLVLLTPRLGITGPAIALVAGYAVSAVYGAFALRVHLARPLRATWPIREWLALLAAYAAGFAVAHATERIYPSVAGLLICLSAGTAAYAGAFFACRGLNVRDRHRMGDAIDRARTMRQRQAIPDQP